MSTTDPREDKQRIEGLSGGLLKEVYIWILDHADFKRWRYEQHDQLLWIEGLPGHGKTMLLCGVINELIKSASESSMKSAARTPIVSFFFCQEHDRRTNTANAVLRGLVFMLVDQQPSLISHVQQQHDKHGKQVFEDNNAWEALSETFISILKDLQSQLQTTYLVIDALDECTTGRDRLLELIVQKSSAYPHSKWIVSSRKWLVIKQSLRPALLKTTLRIELTEASITQAVNTFTRIKVRELAEKMKYTDEFRDAVSWHLFSHAKGGFLWVVLACEELGRGPRFSEEYVWDMLQKFSYGLNQLHTKNFNQCNDLEEDEPLSRKGMLGSEQSDTLISIGNFANTYLSQGRLGETEELQLQVMEANKKPLEPEKSDAINSMENLSATYLNQGRWKEGTELEVQAHKQVLVAEDPDALDFSTGPVVHNKQLSSNLKDYGNPEDSDSSTDLSAGNESVRSLIPNTSAKSLRSESGNRVLILVEEFATLLRENDPLLSLISAGVSKGPIGLESMRNNFPRLLQQFANDLKAEIPGELHPDLSIFVKSYPAMITRELFRMARTDEERNIMPSIPEAGNRSAAVEDRSAQEGKVEDNICPPSKGMDSDEEVDLDSVAKEGGENELLEERSLQRLAHLKHLILKSTAYQTFLRRLENVIRPSLYSRLQGLVNSWSTSENQNHRNIVRYKLRNLITELQHAKLHEIEFDYDQDESRIVRFISYYQHTVERWTGERWDWWPFPRCVRPLEKSETRLRWTCVSISLFPSLLSKETNPDGCHRHVMKSDRQKYQVLLPNAFSP